MFPAYDPELGRRHLAELEPVVFDAASGRTVITYQTSSCARRAHDPHRSAPVRTRTTAPLRFSQATLARRSRRRRLGSKTSPTSFGRICISTIPAGIRCFAMAAGRRPSRTRNTSFTKTSTRIWEAATARGELPPGILAGALPGNSWSYNCRPIVEAGQALLVHEQRSARQYVHPHNYGPLAMPLLRPNPFARPGGRRDRRPHAPRAAMSGARVVDDFRLPSGAQGSAIAAVLLGQVADTSTFVLPIHFPHPHGRPRRR